MQTEEILEQTPFGYLYYKDEGSFPLDIKCEVTEGNITVTVNRHYKGNGAKPLVNKTLTKRSMIINKMTQEQIEQYILDVVDSF